MHQPEPTITVNGQKLSVVDMLTYLGSTLSRAVHIDDEVDDRRSKRTIWQTSLKCVGTQGISLETKLKVFKGGHSAIPAPCM